jgi:hypothetical protein
MATKVKVYTTEDQVPVPQKGFVNLFCLASDSGGLFLKNEENDTIRILLNPQLLPSINELPDGSINPDKIGE